MCLYARLKFRSLIAIGDTSCINTRSRRSYEYNLNSKTTEVSDKEGRIRRDDMLPFPFYVSHTLFSTVKRFTEEVLEDAAHQLVGEALLDLVCNPDCR